jgi:hypothetical protein
MENEKIYSIYFAPHHLLGGICGTRTWKLFLETSEFLTLSQAEHIVNNKYPKSLLYDGYTGVLIIVDRTEFDTPDNF